MFGVKAPCDEAAIAAGHHPGPDRAPDRRMGRWVLVTTILGSSMVFIDGTIVNVALPVLQVQLHASGPEVQWVVEAYTLFLSALLLVGGALGDRFGRRRIFAAGVAMFSLASAACGLASSPAQMIAARAVQGLGGALLAPGSLAIISAFFPEDERGRAIGTWSGASGVFAAVGPLLGGLLIDQGSWRWAFFINVPIGVVVLILAAARLPESRDPSARSLDVPGAALVTAGLGALVYGLIESSTRGFGDPLIGGALAAGCAGLALFAWVETHSRAPMLPPALFRSRAFTGANLLTLLLYGALAGALYFLPFDLLQVQGYSATGAGAAFLPFIAMVFLLSRSAGALMNRVGARLPLVIGPTIAAAGFVLLALAGVGGSYATTFFPGMVVLGLGMALTIAPLTTTVMSSVDASHAGVASGVNNAVSRSAGLLAIAVLGIVMVGAFTRRLESLLAVPGISPEVRRSILRQRDQLAAIRLPPGVDGALRGQLRAAIEASFLHGFRLVMIACGGLALGGALFAWILIPPLKPRPR
jgi:EmrB/QacA subfamily drug resistance transporter